MPRVLKRLQDGEAIPVEAWDRDGKVKLATGKLLTVDNQIDPATGTVKLKAEFANDNAALFPNQFVNVRMLLNTLADATLIPSAAIQRGAPGTFVYVVKDDKSVSVAPVKLGPVQGETTADRQRPCARRPGRRRRRRQAARRREGRVDHARRAIRTGTSRHAPRQPWGRSRRRPSAGRPAARPVRQDTGGAGTGRLNTFRDRNRATSP